MKKQKTLNPKEILIAVIGAIIVLVLIDLTPLGGNTYYYVNWIRCGNEPLHGRGVGIEGGVPRYESSLPKFAFVRGMTTYFCTPHEAELAGYSADARVYRFPHLTDREIRKVMEQKLPNLIR